MMVALLQRLLNRCLIQDPAYLVHLAPLAGHSFALRIQDTPLKILFFFHHTFIEVKPDRNEYVNLRLTGSLSAFLAFLTLKKSRTSLLQQQRIEFEGDLHQLEAVEALWHALGFDFSFWLKQAASFKQGILNRIEYEQEDRKSLASPGLFRYFTDSLEELELRIDRVASRLTQTHDTRSIPPENPHKPLQ